jgi:hypothetical protein
MTGYNSQVAASGEDVGSGETQFKHRYLARRHNPLVKYTMLAHLLHIMD